MKKITTEILKAVENSNNILVCGHIRPDGDCIGSALAVSALCQRLGKSAVAVCDADKPVGFSFLPDYDRFGAFDANAKYDLFIAVDTANAKRLGAYKEVLDRAENSIDIDHHPTNEKYGKINHIDPAAASTCSIVFELFEDTGLIDTDIAEMLYTGLSTDTGHFMHSNTDAIVFETAAKLCGYNLDIAAINHRLYCQKSINRVKLAARAMGGIKLYGGGKVALMTITADDMGECGCTSEDTEGLIDYASEIAGTEISVSMCEQPGGLYRVSFRSVSADVSKVAAVFGGGGHKLAAGCIVSGGNRHDVAARITDAALAALGIK